MNAIVAAAQAIAAMPQGRLDAETTANVGLISGGTATNVVADLCQVESEVRGIDQVRVDEVVTQSVDALQDAADGAGADLDIGLQRMFTGYRVRPGEPGGSPAAAAQTPTPSASTGWRSPTWPTEPSARMSAASACPSPR